MAGHPTIMCTEPNTHNPPPVTRLCEVDAVAVASLLAQFGLRLVRTSAAALPGSYWGEDEAGLIGAELFVRDATPVHSLMHEACHFICMDDARRATLHTDAGGDDLEECAVCYLQIVLAARIPAYGSAQMMADMDAWGYTFRLGSARRWFEEDAEDARIWLQARGLPTDVGGVTPESHSAGVGGVTAAGLSAGVGAAADRGLSTDVGAGTDGGLSTDVGTATDGGSATDSSRC